MKIHVAYDKEGRILTAVSREDASGPYVTSQEQQGLELADFETPRELGGKRFRELPVNDVRVDTVAKRLVVNHPKR
jgi:hypothetical protein